jgi:hypothetical protein
MLEICRCNKFHVVDKSLTDVGGKLSYSCTMRLIDRREFDIGSASSSESGICHNYKILTMSEMRGNKQTISS